MAWPRAARTGEANIHRLKLSYTLVDRSSSLLSLCEHTQPQVVACGDVGGPPLEHLYKKCNDVFLPLLSNPTNQVK